MGRLSTVRPALSSSKPRLGFVQGDIKAQGKSREAFAPWRAWYRTARWAKLRAAVLLRDHYTCQMCGRVAPSPDLVCDHVEPHRGDETRFWAGPFQTLCHSPCHSKWKQIQERADG